MKTRSVVAHGLLVISIGVMAAGCAHTNTKVVSATSIESVTSARGTSVQPGATGARYHVDDADGQDSAVSQDSPGTLATADKLTPENEADMARAMLFFPVFGVRVPIW